MTSHFTSLFFGGAFFINAIPHFVEGISGRKFPTPFAKPPGLGDSSAMVNVLWGTFNFLVTYLLLCTVAEINLRDWVQVVLAATGGLLMALCLAYSFGPKREKYRAHM
jgi:hypothetical protein